MVLYEELNNSYRYQNYPENNLGEKIRKTRNMKGFTAKELGDLCSCSLNTIYAYESNIAIPNPHAMKKIIKVLDVDIEYFEDDYYNFVLSKDYTELLKKWRKENTKHSNDVKNILNVSFQSFWGWENGNIMSRQSFNQIRDKIYIE